MKVTIEFCAQARTLAGKSEMQVSVAPSAHALDAVQQALHDLTPNINIASLRDLLLDQDGEIHSWVLVAVDDSAVHDAATCVLAENARIRLLPPVSGG